MNIKFYFKNLRNNPECSISIGSQECYRGSVHEFITVNCEHTGPFDLSITFTNKTPEDTKIDSLGNIVDDKSFELEKIAIDDYYLDELIWDGYYQDNNNTVYKSCLFFGPPGKFIIKLSSPILPWILKTKHERYNNDPNWEEDYQYYLQACKILEQI